MDRTLDFLDFLPRREAASSVEILGLKGVDHA